MAKLPRVDVPKSCEINVPAAGNHTEFHIRFRTVAGISWEDTMAVAVLSRWSGGDREKFIASAKKYKPILEKLGVEVRAGQISTGPHAGQWVRRLALPTGKVLARGCSGF